MEGPHWIETKDRLPPEEELVLGDDGCDICLVTFCGGYWRYSMFESKVGPIYWCKIPERIRNV